MKSNNVYYGDKPPKDLPIGSIFISKSGQLAVRGRSSDGKMSWDHIHEKPDNSKENVFYEYLKDQFGLTKEEFINILKKEHPESLI